MKEIVSGCKCQVEHVPDCDQWRRCFTQYCCWQAVYSEQYR